MPRIPCHRPTLLALTLLTLVACGPVDDVGSQEANLAECNADQVELDWVEAEGLTTTSKRVASLNDYAARKLRARQCEIDETLAFRDALSDQRPNIADLYRVQVGNEATCLNGGFFFASFDLESDKRYRAMKDQVDMTVEFLKQFHEDSFGIETVIFDSVVLCPKEAFGEEMSLTGPTLYINLPFGQLGGIETFDARELRADKWAQGAHLATWPKAELLQTIWPLFDPAGTVRYALRSGVANRALGLLGKLVDFGGNVNGGAVDVSTMRSQLLGLVGEHTSETVETEAGVSLRDAAADRIENASPEQLQCIAEAWSLPLDDPRAWVHATEAAVATVYREAARNSLDVKVKQKGTIVVGNTHFVNVNLDVFLSSGYESLERYVEVVEVPQNIEWEQEGFVVVYTVDDIDINVSVEHSRTLQSASLAQALASCP